MSRRISPRFHATPFSDIRRQIWGNLFGRFIQHDRRKKGRSVKEAARKAGMEAAEWKAIEAGHVPTTREQLKSLAIGLDMEWERMVFIATFCRHAWGR